MYEEGGINKEIVEMYFSTLPDFTSAHEDENFVSVPVLGKEHDNPVMPYGIAEILLAYDIKDREDKIAKEAEKNINVRNLNQQEYDALLIHIYQRGSITERMKELLGKEKNRKAWEDEFKDEEDKINRRYQAEINMFFDGDYEYVYTH